MDWALILVMTMGGPVSQTQVGYLASEQTCKVAGFGMATVLQAANPGLLVAFACKKRVSA